MSSTSPRHFGGVLAMRLAAELVVGQDDLERRGGDGAGRDGVDAHTRRAVGRHESCHVRQSGLGGPVGDEPAVAQAPHGRGDVDDRPPVAVQHVGEHGLAQREGRRDVPAERLLEGLDRRVEEPGRHGATRVVDHDVDAPELAHRRVDEGVEVGEVADVGREDERPPTEGAHLPGDVLELGLGAGRDRDVGTRLRERRRAQPAPMPRPAPVTRATLSVRRKRSISTVPPGDGDEAERYRSGR